MKRRILLSLGLIGLTGALSLSHAGLPDFDAKANMRDLKARASKMSEPRSQRAGGPAAYSSNRANQVNVNLGTYLNASGLPNCGGSVDLRIIRGQPVVTFRNVASCSNFDILDTNYAPVRYPNQKLGGYDNNRSGSFSIPRSFLSWGYNSIIVSMQSNSGKTRDLIEVNFAAW